MPTYSSSNNWIKQPDEQITTFPSGLIKTTQSFIFPGKTTTYPPAPSGSSVFPDPVLEQLDTGFTRAVVNSYRRKTTGGEMIDQGDGTSVGTGQYTAPVKTKSKVVKTGNAVMATLYAVGQKDGENLIYVPKLIVETFSFEYLTGQILVEGVSTQAPLTPTLPNDAIECTLIKAPPGFGTSHIYGNEWLISAYSAESYGDIYETKYAYEGFAKMYIYRDLAGNLSGPKPPPMPAP